MQQNRCSFRGFLLVTTKQHLWIVLNDPAEPDCVVVIVNLTTAAAYKQPSNCTLHPGDHPFVKHESFVAFQHATLTRVNNLQRALRVNVFRKHAELKPEVLRRVQNAAIHSPLLNPDCKRVLARYLAS